LKGEKKNFFNPARKSSSIGLILPKAMGLSTESARSVVGNGKYIHLPLKGRKRRKTAVQGTAWKTIAWPAQFNRQKA